MKTGHLIVVTNRLPVTVKRTDSGLQIKPSTGGLITSLDPVLSQTGGCWVGWTGTDYLPEIAECFHRQSEWPYALVPVFLTHSQSCSDDVLGPLFHQLPSRGAVDAAYWDNYRAVNEMYADAVGTVAHDDDFVWVHDYRLMLLAGALLARGLSVRAAYFHHLPFPSPEVFEKLPWRTEIIGRLLQFHTLSFQTARDRRNFLACVRRFSGDARIAAWGASSWFVLETQEPLPARPASASPSARRKRPSPHGLSRG